MSVVFQKEGKYPPEKYHSVSIHPFAHDIKLFVCYNPMMSDELENATQLLFQCIAKIRARMLMYFVEWNGSWEKLRNLENENLGSNFVLRC